MLIKSDPDIIQSYFEDYSNLKGGHATEVVYPQTGEELSEFMRQMARKKVPVTISGGGTGTTGGRIPFGGVALSMEKFNTILRISKDEMSATVQAGVPVEDLKNAAEEHGLFYTCHPTERSAFVGGTVSTNASGARSYRYGATRRFVRAITMVLSGGQVLKVRRGERLVSRADHVVRLSDGSAIDIPLPSYAIPQVKNASGYCAYDGMDLIDLFVGQEGTLSVMTEVEIALVKRPERIYGLFVFFKKEEEAWRFASDVRSHKERSILSIEYFDRTALDIVSKKERAIPAGVEAALYVEQELSLKDADEALSWWESFLSHHGVSDDHAWVGTTDGQIERFNDMRHAIPEGLNEIFVKSGYQKVSVDISVPEKAFLEMMRFYTSSCRAKKIPFVVFGHMGECHVHVNIMPRSDEELAVARDLCLLFVRRGLLLGGTVSAEHGIGKIKHRYLEEMHGHKGMVEMAKIKKACDPACILGLDNIFPKELLRGL